MYFCDRCLDPFHSYDCDPAIVPDGEDWSELCPACQDWKLRCRELDDETIPEAAE